MRKPSPGFLSKGSQLRAVGLIFLGGLALLAWERQRRPIDPRAGQKVSEDLDFTIKSPTNADDGVVMVAIATPEENSPPRPPGTFVTERELRSVEDNTLGLSRREFELVANVLGRLNQAPPAAIEAAGRRDASFTVLMKQPDAYRGQVVHFRADLRRLTDFRGLENYGGPELVADAYVFTEESGNNPMRVLALDADGSLPRGEQFAAVPVEFDGVFIKRFGYASRGGQSVAPLLLARTISPLPVQPKAVPADPTLPVMVVAGSLLMMLVAVLKVRRRQPRVGFSTRGTDREVFDTTEPAQSPEDYFDELSSRDDDGTA